MTRRRRRSSTPISTTRRSRRINAFLPPSAAPMLAAARCISRTGSPLPPSHDPRNGNTIDAHCRRAYRALAGDRPIDREPVELIDQRVAARIRTRRIYMGITLQALARQIGVAFQQAHKYERGLSRGRRALLRCSRLENAGRVLFAISPERAPATITSSMTRASAPAAPLRRAPAAPPPLARCQSGRALPRVLAR